MNCFADARNDDRNATALLLRRLLLAALSVEPDRAPGESGGVEIALATDALEVQDRAQAAGRGLRLDGVGRCLRCRAVRHRLGHHAPDQIAVGFWREPQELCDGGADV